MSTFSLRPKHGSPTTHLRDTSQTANQSPTQTIGLPLAIIARAQATQKGTQVSTPAPLQSFHISLICSINEPKP